MHQTVTSLITEVQSVIHQPSPQIERLSQLKNEIMQKMEYIEILNGVYKEKSQMTFLNTFKKIMHQLSDELKNAVQAYQNIDYQISQDQKCLLLSKQTQFFKNQRMSMEQIYQQQLNKLDEVKSRNNQLKRKRNQLQAKSVLKQQRLSLYQTKNRSLSLKMNQSIQYDIKQKRLTESTKIPTTGQRTRIITYDSSKKKPLFKNYETQNKIFNYSQFQRSKHNKKNNIRSQNSSRVKVNSFFL